MSVAGRFSVAQEVRQMTADMRRRQLVDTLVTAAEGRVEVKRFLVDEMISLYWAPL